MNLAFLQGVEGVPGEIGLDGPKGVKVSVRYMICKSTFIQAQISKSIKKGQYCHSLKFESQRYSSQEKLTSLASINIFNFHFKL